MRQAYRFTVPPVSRLPWCIMSVGVSSRGTGCEMTPRCGPQEDCDPVTQRCVDAQVHATTNSNINLCLNDQDCGNRNFCQGNWTCGSGSTCVPPRDGPCTNNQSFPQCNSETQTCEAASGFGIGFPLWVLIVVIGTILCFILCVVTLCSMESERAYDAYESQTYVAAMNAQFHASRFDAKAHRT